MPRGCTCATRVTAARTSSCARPTPPRCPPTSAGSIGSHDENETLYPALLRGAAAVAAPGARFGVLTHDVRRFEAVLRADSAWVLDGSWRFFQKGHHPRLYLLRLQ